MIDCNCASFYFLRERMEKVFERKTKEDRPVLAICYDFDKTLSPDDMQAQGYIQSVGYEVESFWTESNGLAESNDMDQNLAYMYTMIQKARGRFIFNRKTLMDYGAKVSLFPGVDTWFKRIREYGETKGVIVEHYIISSGLKEMIEGTKVANEFEKIYASSFLSASALASASAFMRSISSLLKPLLASIRMVCSLPVALSFADTLRIPLASMSKVTSI